MTETLDNQSVTGTEQEAQVKTYTQEEFDAAMKKTRLATEQKVSKKYEGLEDLDYIKNLLAQEENRKQEEQVKRGEFENVLKELASKKDAEIAKRDQVIREYKLTQPLLQEASAQRSISPEQVKALLANNLRLNDEGNVEVIDGKGQVRYNEQGAQLGVKDLVQEFLSSNPHFVQPTPATTHSQSSHNTGADFDITSLDMSNAEHRKLYAKARAEGKI